MRGKPRGDLGVASQVGTEPFRNHRTPKGSKWFPRLIARGSREETDTFFGPGSPGWHSGKDGEVNTTASDAGNTVATTGTMTQTR